MKYKHLAAAVVGIICLNNPISASAAETHQEMTGNMNSTSDEAVPYAEGLISTCYLHCYGGNKVIYIDSNTSSPKVMKEIGLINIKIQKSTDKVNWTKEKSVDDLIIENSSSHAVTNYSVPVEGGYYYRVTYTHYAKEKGLFGSSQSINDTSNSVWVSN